MIDNSIFRQHTFLPKQAEACGFHRENGSYTVQRPLRENGFYAVFRISESNVSVDVYEEPDDELYLPFHTDADGSFVGKIRADVDEAFGEILSRCFAPTDVKMILLDYVRETYGTVPEAPWDYLKEYHTLKTAKRQKWYGVFMLIPYTCLGLAQKGKINVLNLKMKPENIPPLIDRIHYFPAYHMNKKYWVSVLLDRDADVAAIQKLLDESYALVEGNHKTASQS